jgi:Asp-tRNA(Asn)/Glu-tRNA(Gln) amidotransferase A subunit family amidase
MVLDLYSLVREAAMTGFPDATEQAARVRRGEMSPRELLEETIDAIERVDPELNAVVIPLFEKARAEAASAPDGPFRGVPYLLKDLSLVSKGDHTSQAVPGAKAANYRAAHDSFFVEKMRAAGFVLVGKTNLPQLGASATATSSTAWGTTRNPWDPARSPGGSSGGSAAAVAAGLVAVADGTDAVGSIRIPAAHCGLVGLKPTRGRVSTGPDPFCDSLAGLAAEMCLVRSVRDLAAVLDVVSGRCPGDPFSAPPPLRPFAAEVGADPGRLRIGVLTRDPAGMSTVDSGCASATRATADLLAGLGHDVTEGFPPVLARGAFPPGFGAAMAVTAARSASIWADRLGRQLTEGDFEPGTWGGIEFGRTVSAVDYTAAVDALRERGREIESWWADDGWDLLLTPATPAPPPLDDPGDTDPATFTCPFNVSGQPAIALPLHTDPAGLPIGVQLAAAHGREDVLIRVAAQLETALPWADRWPAVMLDGRDAVPGRARPLHPGT